jgi:L,D-transpeptidase YcbB
VISAINKVIVALVFTVFSLCACIISSEGDVFFPFIDAEVSMHIMRQSAQGIAASKKTVLGEQVRSAVLVEGFYKGRAYQPAWSRAGRLILVDMLIKELDAAYGDGLSPAYYHLERIRSLVDDAGRELSHDPERLADLDILLTDSFLTLACHLSAGCSNPLPAASQWYAKSSRVDVSTLLEQALMENRISGVLAGLRPEKGIYIRLKSSLAQYRELASKGEWPVLPAGPSLKKGSRSHRVAELRKRLAVSGELNADEAGGGNIFDAGLERSVIAFQKRHGLDGNGVVGRETRSALNVPLKQRIRQMALNMERLRWIHGNLGERHIFVNIADFQMNVVEKDKPVLSMKVVVGKPSQNTPVFTAKMTHIVINPSWHIPKSIIQKEILGKIAKNPDYLASQDIEVLEHNGHPVAPQTIDWSTMPENASQYRFRQKPGVRNALGHMKFIFPNSYDVYLHDTPSRRLFSRNVRAFSHGCVRIENPIGLAEYLFRDDLVWTRDKLISAIGKGAEKVVRISQPIDVHLIYLTSWVDEGYILHFRNDIYGSDKSFNEALRKRPYIQ